MKIFIILVLLVLISGCITSEPDEKAPIDEEINMDAISIFSDVFENGDMLSSEYTCDGSDVSPYLSWDQLPAGTKSIALIADDPDAPGQTWVHWVIYNIPANSSGLPPDVPKDNTLNDGSLQGTNDFGRIGYNGPCPPPGTTHRYFFKVYALDTILNLTSGATKSQLEAAMSGHILAHGEIIGKYGR